ncbi:hypothetical protein [Riemerella anatipestifer]|uniref:hypothetical protein n=1 Tax=Riemerella anatipestifer TaxID=34085 RepID=UPI001BDA6A76|nr:hypothetical protein [Riemerella anatipestifer]MBT0554559.1 hypothetical protein [Riemerella anatipestifer]MCU7560762.1 hypothetical protein [Riemerella anatipestifer]MDY3450084.1 hypothetical protein [Riemerella anatipestifer]QYR06174.1 hypothetical protein J6M09_05955 [Riemerella anatipestifer]
MKNKVLNTKKWVAVLAVVVSTGFAHAQTDYQSQLQKSIVQMEQSKNAQELASVTKAFAKIAEENPNQWLPYYYVSYNSVMEGFRGNYADKTKLETLANQAEEWMKKAEALSPENAEIYILKARINGLRMMINPQKYYATDGKSYGENLAKAKKLSPNNPRITLLEAETVYYTPKEHGGSKELGLKLFEKALKQFETQEAEQKLLPHWGKKEAQYFLSLK